jgi:FtsH-binding integral membrane protein
MTFHLMGFFFAKFLRKITCLGVVVASFLLLFFGSPALSFAISEFESFQLVIPRGLATGI